MFALVVPKRNAVGFAKSGEHLPADLTRALPCGFVSAPREQLIAVGPWARAFRLRAARARGNPAYP
jgi:hypothetical protein